MQSNRKQILSETAKNVDNIIHCDEYIQANYQNEDYALPHVLVSPFSFHNDMFFITNYVEGCDLDTLDSKLSDTQWEKAAVDIRKQLILLANIHTPCYSEHNKFFTDEYPEMFRKKLQTRIKHISLTGYDENKMRLAYNNSLRILNNSTFSEPSLIHMDVKPANIVFDLKTEKAVLIDLDEVCIRLDKDNGTKFLTMLEMFTTWQEQADRYRSGKISKEDYDNWRYNYPTNNNNK